MSTPPQGPDFSPPASTEPAGRPWLGVTIGLVIVTVMIGYLIYSSRTDSTSRQQKPVAVMQSAPADPYAAKLELGDIKMSQAENMLGGSSIYVEGKIKNTGDKTATGATIEITFKNSLGEVVQRESHPLMVILRREPAEDVSALNAAPLNPGDSREFRQTFERVSADWNRQYPELRITTVTTR